MVVPTYVDHTARAWFNFCICIYVCMYVCIAWQQMGTRFRKCL
jgi:hypothetical protein